MDKEKERLTPEQGQARPTEEEFISDVNRPSIDKREAESRRREGRNSGGEAPEGSG